MRNWQSHRLIASVVILRYLPQQLFGAPCPSVIMWSDSRTLCAIKIVVATCHPPPTHTHTHTYNPHAERHVHVLNPVRQEIRNFEWIEIKSSLKNRAKSRSPEHVARNIGLIDWLMRERSLILTGDGGLLETGGASDSKCSHGKSALYVNSCKLESQIKKFFLSQTKKEYRWSEGI